VQEDGAPTDNGSANGDKAGSVDLPALPDRAEQASEAARDAEDAADRAQEARDQAEEELSGDPLLDSTSHRVAAGADPEHPLGVPGEPLRGFSPFRTGFMAALGVAGAYVLLRAVVAVQEVIILVVVAAFLAVGLDPAVGFLMRRAGLRRGYATAAVIGGLLIFFGGFVAAAVQPIADQATDLVHQFPSYLDRLQRGNGFLADLNQRYHLVDQLRRRAEAGPTLGLAAIGGVVGVGKAVLSAVFSVVTGTILTTYFLANLHGIKRGMLRLVPRSRRPRVGLITDEVLRRIGGYVLGNLATSLVAGLTAFIYLEIVRVPYALALALLVAILDLVPLVGATIAAVIVTIVAFFVSPAVGIATGLYFIAYQQFENYILVPRVMKRTVDVSPLATIVAALIGGTLLGVVGALLAIPAAATVSLLIGEVVYPRQDEG
jgi:predicted PurR-regulated permease PerM